MRLFYAINFRDNIKDELYEIICRLKEEAVKGNFTRRENLHLTLAFLGEVPKEHLKKAIGVMENISSPCFKLQLQGLGCFKRTGGDIYWLGVGASPVLNNLQRCLKTEVKLAGFALEKREFKPHLTLGRELVFPSSFNMQRLAEKSKTVEANIESISLMESLRISGKLVYREVYSKKLAPI